VAIGKAKCVGIKVSGSSQVYQLPTNPDPITHFACASLESFNHTSDDTVITAAASSKHDPESIVSS
jgi:hypothetical protein